MKKIICAFVLLACSGVGAQTFNFRTDYDKVLARTRDSKDPLFYETQIKRFTSHDLKQTDLEVLSLLIAFSQRKEFGPMKDAFRESIIKELIEAQKYDEALQIANKLLKTNPLNVKGIYQKAYALGKTGQKDSAQVYDKQWQKILKAMFLSGKGTAITDATFSLGPDDGSVFIGQFIGGQVLQMRTEKNNAGQSFAVYEVQFEKRKLTLYFAIDHAVKRMEEEEQRR